MKLKAASEFNSFWMSTLNKAQVGREGGKGHDNTHRRGGEGQFTMMEPAAGLHVTREYNRLWNGHSKAKVGREGGEVCYNTIIGGKGKVVYKMF